MNNRRIRRGVRLVLLCAALTSFAPMTMSTASAEPPLKVWAQVRNVYSQKCLVTQDGYYTEAFQFGCTTTYDDQYWKPVYAGERDGLPLYYLVNDQTNGCLVIPGGSRLNGARAAQWPCNPCAQSSDPANCDSTAFAEMWAFTDRYGTPVTPGSGRVHIVNFVSRRCLAQQHSTQSGAPIFQYACDRNWTDQQWELISWR